MIRLSEIVIRENMMRTTASACRGKNRRKRGRGIWTLFPIGLAASYFLIRAIT